METNLVQPVLALGKLTESYLGDALMGKPNDWVLQLLRTRKKVGEWKIIGMLVSGINKDTEDTIGFE